MSAIFIIVSVLTCVAVTVVIKALLAESFRQGHRLGYRQGTYDALKTDLAASKTAFPHR